MQIFKEYSDIKKIYKVVNYELMEATLELLVMLQLPMSLKKVFYIRKKDEKKHISILKHSILNNLFISRARCEHTQLLTKVCAT